MLSANISLKNMYISEYLVLEEEFDIDIKQLAKVIQEAEDDYYKMLSYKETDVKNL